MKTVVIASSLMLLLIADLNLHAQQTREMQYFRYPDQRGLNVFEAPKETDVVYDGLNLRIGGANTLQFQALTHSNDGPELLDIGPNFNLATSNLDLDVQLHNGVRMHLRTYLSSRHHPEAWVKGGYIQVDRLDFIQEDFMTGLMDRISIKVGHMDINYGDTHFRRSDNAQALFNPFVGNYIMDSFTTEVGGEVYYQHAGFLAMVGLTNGKLNQSVVVTTPPTRPSMVGKLGYDSQVNENLRTRLTGSIYRTSQAASITLYGGDRAGSRYYNIMSDGEAGNFTGRFNPGFSAPGVGGEMTAIMINPFIKFRGLEFFGVYENSTGQTGNEANSRTFQQFGSELIYRLGAAENIYFGGRYNLVTGEQVNTGNDIDITRINLGGGWFMTRNILAKVEYVNQTYEGFPSGSLLDNGEFSGFVVEAVISF